MENITQSAQNTQKLGQNFTNYLKPNSQKSQVIFLYGELGSGKTTFVQGMAKTLGLTHRIISPTFIISKRYQLHNKPWDYLFHLDLYRIKSIADLESLGLNEIFQNPKNLVVVEWPEMIEKIYKDNIIKINFNNIGEDKRKISIFDNFVISNPVRTG